MKISRRNLQSREGGGALMLTMIMTGVALAVLAGAMAWSATSTRQTHRMIQYQRSVSAAEAATEMVLGKMSQDFTLGGDQLLADHMNSYQFTVPTESDSSFWKKWKFDDGRGHSGQTYVSLTTAATNTSINSAYTGLRGFESVYSIGSHAQDTAASQNVVGGVVQELRLQRIPIFQFAMYSAGDMEISCGQQLTIKGRVHSNKDLYVEPDSTLIFQTDVTAVGKVMFKRDPAEGTSRGAPKGSVVYVNPNMPVFPVPALTLPIGATNTPEAIREIIQPVPVGESPSSPIGRLRYHNLADLIITVNNTNVVGTSGRFNNFATSLTTNDVRAFIVTNNSFMDYREEKTIHPIDINIGMLKLWSETNGLLRPLLPTKDVTSVYVIDKRTYSGTNLGAVRVFNGRFLPTKGLTVATARPLYVWGHYNQTSDLNLNTTNTTTTLPASLVGDAITILSQTNASAGWRDANSAAAVASRNATPTTVNAAFLTGVVESANDKYSGGMENFPRFLETWGAANAIYYAGSMVKMFPSLYATNAWGKANVYAAPQRVWTYDLNFENGAKLPPLTPSFVRVLRGQWYTVAANQNTKSP